jgi:peptide-methionine (S)-S-oxide reductase
MMLRTFVTAAMISLLAAVCMGRPSGAALPDPAIDAAPAQGDQSVVFAGGCFWGVQAVFQHVKGVKEATSGYAGGSAQDAHYETVSTGATGHAESVKVVYDPAKVSFGQLLKIFFAVAHNPTELDRQGPDTGTQYRSEIFYTTPEQQKIAKSYIDQLDSARAFPKPIVTTLEPLDNFFAAEDYHQNYAETHPDNMYIYLNDAPKVERLKEQFPDLYR